MLCKECEYTITEAMPQAYVTYGGQALRSQIQQGKSPDPHCSALGYDAENSHL